MHGILRLEIAHRRITLVKPAHSASKICYDLTLGDIIPPDGIKTLHLEGVCIDVNISSLLSTPNHDADEWREDFSSGAVPEVIFDDLLRPNTTELLTPFSQRQS